MLCRDRPPANASTVFCSIFSLVFRRSRLNGLDLRRVEIHRDDADHQKHAENYVQNRDACVIGALEDKSLPSLIRRRRRRSGGGFQGIPKILMGNADGGRKSWARLSLPKYLESGVWRGFGKGKRASDLRLRPQASDTVAARCEGDIVRGVRDGGATLRSLPVTARVSSNPSSGSGLRGSLGALA